LRNGSTKKVRLLSATRLSRINFDAEKAFIDAKAQGLWGNLLFRPQAAPTSKPGRQN